MIILVDVFSNADLVMVDDFSTLIFCVDAFEKPSVAPAVVWYDTLLLLVGIDGALVFCVDAFEKPLVVLAVVWYDTLLLLVGIDGAWLLAMVIVWAPVDAEKR